MIVPGCSPVQRATMRFSIENVSYSSYLHAPVKSQHNFVIIVLPSTEKNKILPKESTNNAHAELPPVGVVC